MGRLRLWWELLPDRFVRELRSYEQNGLGAEVDEGARAAGQLVIHCDAQLEYGKPRERVTVVYPDTFPFTRFTIFAPNLLLNRHQNPIDRNLCMMARSSDAWRPSMMAGDLIAQDLPKDIQLIRAGGTALRDAEDPQGEPQTTFLPFADMATVLVDEEVAAKIRGVSHGRCRLRFGQSSTWLNQVGTDPPYRSVGRALLERVSGPDGTVLYAQQHGRLPALGGIVRDVPWALIKGPPAVKNGFEALSEIMKVHGIKELPPEPFEGADQLLRFGAGVIEEEVERDVRGLTWVFPVIAKRKGKAREVTATILRGMRYGPSTRSTRIPELSALTTAKVAVLGLGTIGLPILRELVMGGVGEVRLGDPDFIDPATAPRWLDALEFAGANKAVAAQKLVARWSPATKVEEALPVYVGYGHRGKPREELDSIERLLDGASLLIDATGEDNVHYALHDVATQLGVPQIYAWSQEGLGGVVARIERPRTGCFWCLSKALSSGVIPPPLDREPTKTRRVQPHGCSDPTFTAASFELAPVSIQAASVAASTLSRGVPNGFPDSNKDVWIFSSRDADGRLLEAPIWRAHSLPQHPECKTCSGA